MHYTEYVEPIKQLKREKRYPEAINLLLKCVNATEQEAKRDGCGVAPWYYQQLATIYNKEGQIEKEIDILERYAEQNKARGVMPKKLEERLNKLRNS